MKFAVGYQLPDGDEEPLVEVVRDFREHIAEVYFPWADMPSGRAPLAPHILDNRRFPDDWFERTSACDRRCHACGYCQSVLDEVLVDLGGM